MTPEEAIAKLKTLPEDKQRAVLARLSPDERKGIMGKLSEPQPEAPKKQKSMLDLLLTRDPSLTEIRTHQSDTPAHAVEDVLGNIGAGGLGVLLHPVETAKSVGRFLKDPFTPGHPEATKLVENLSERPLETVESGIGQAAVMGAGGKALESTIKAVPPAAKGVARFVTKTTPKVAGELAEETRAGNEAAVTKAAEENAKAQEKHAGEVSKIEEKRKTDLKKHFDKTSAAEKSNTEAQGKVSRKEAINRGVERLDTEVRGDLEGLEKKIHAQANANYNTLRAALKNEKAAPYQAYDEDGTIQGSPVSMVEHLYDVANEPIRGTETETPIVKSLGKRTENGDVDLSYNDLQGYREEIGRELRKGTLAPDVFTSYKNLMNAIDDAMDEIAARKGMKPQQDAARAYYRQYAETFLDRDAIARKALDSQERGGVAKAYQGKDQSGIERIARFDPAVAERLNNLRGYQGEAKALPSKPGKLQSLPHLPPKPALPAAPAPVVPEVKTIGPEDIQAAKLKSLTGKGGGIDTVKKVGSRIVNYGLGLHALWDAFSGRFAGLPRDVGLGVAGYAATEAFAKLLERPEIQEMLTKPTAADVAQIPPELRANLGPMLDAAKAKGIQVSPALYAAAGAPQKKRLASVLPSVQ